MPTGTFNTCQLYYYCTATVLLLLHVNLSTVVGVFRFLSLMHKANTDSPLRNKSRGTEVSFLLTTR